MIFLKLHLFFLVDNYPVLYTGKNGTCAHEFIIDLKHIKDAHIESEDIAKRLIDYGFHSPTMSWPVAGINHYIL